MAGQLGEEIGRIMFLYLNQIWHPDTEVIEEVL